MDGTKYFLDVKTEEFTPYQTGVWYEYEIRVGKNSLAAFENGKLFLQSPATDGAFWKPFSTGNKTTLYTVAHRNTKTGELLIRIVNMKTEPVDVQIKLDNWSGKTDFAVEETVLTSEKNTDRNSLDEPEKVVPKTSEFKESGTSFTYKVKANSLTNLRLK